MQLKSLIKNYIRQKTLRTGKWVSIYRRFVAQSSQEWGEYMARWGGLNSCGSDVVINIGCNITDPYLVRIGNNVTLSACTLLGHDAVVRVVNKARGLKLDSVGPIEIKDNSFIGHGAIVMPNVCIGPNSVVAAGSVVTKDVPPGVVVGGVPATYICTFDEMVNRLKRRSAAYPWIDLIEKRIGAYDPDLEPQLRAMRVKHFYPHD
jgi:acetyltransferase-like isoleucine patch superfamily enzyme